MKNKNESALDIFAANSTCTRRDLVHRFAVTAVAAAVPAFIAAACDNGSNDGAAAKYSISFEVTFSKPMDTGSVEYAISTSPAGADMGNAVITWSEGNTVMYCKADVSTNATYTVVIQETAADTKGRYLDGNGDGTAGDPYSFNVPAV